MIKNEITERYKVSKKYYRANEVVNYLGIGLSTVWLYAKQKRLTAIKLSSRVTVFDINEINNLILDKEDKNVCN